MAQKILSAWLAYGVGVIKDEVNAYKWVLLSSANGYDSASLMSDLEKSLTAEQQVEGQKLATEWQEEFETR